MRPTGREIYFGVSSMLGRLVIGFSFIFVCLSSETARLFNFIGHSYCMSKNQFSSNGIRLYDKTVMCIDGYLKDAAQ